MNNGKRSPCSHKLRPFRLGIPSKGRMEIETQQFLKNCGFNFIKKNRQYIGYIPEPCSIQLVFERQEDIISCVRNGTIELGIVGYDLFRENVSDDDEKVIMIHDALNFGECSLEIAVPEVWNIDSLKALEEKQINKLRIATKFPKLTEEFLKDKNISFEIIEGKGSLEVYPELGHSDLIVDLVSTGQTLKDNRLKTIKGGKILTSQAILIGNKVSLMNSNVLRTTRELIEYFEATLRAQNFVSVFVNMRGSDEQEIIKAIFTKEGLNGLQGPTISPVYTKSGEKMFAIHVIVEKKNLQLAIGHLRDVGGSGVVVAETLYIFEEEPLRFKNLKERLGIEND